MSVLKLPYINYVCVSWHLQNVIIYTSDLHNLQNRRKKIKRVANDCKGSFCQCKNQKYLQIWLLPKFPIMFKKHNLQTIETPKKLKNS